MHLRMHLLFLLFIPTVICKDKETTDNPEEHICALPEVTTIANKTLNIEQFRSEFARISEVKFTGMIGPLNEKQFCKIKCIDGNWVGPLCSDTADGRFQPVLRECSYRNDHPHLAIWFKNASIVNGTQFPHGSVILARCKQFGQYKMKGDSNLRCENGEWVPKMPECVPTTINTNFSNDAPPSIRYTVDFGSAVVDHTGNLCVYPDSNVRLDCISKREFGDPEWTWTQASGNHEVGWAQGNDEKDLVYRLNLIKMTARHSDKYTCTSPNGHTNTITVKVVNIACAPLVVSASKVRVFSQGTRLGHVAHFSCQLGYRLDGDHILTCMANGLWSSHPPNCVETFCPAFGSLGAQLSLVEYNSSFGGRAVFQCAWGYRLVGAPGIECEMDGTWSSQPPHCAPIYCPVPSVPERGRLLTNSSKENKYPVGDLMIYSCEEGYEIVGESSIVCTENGFWSHPPPFCMPPSERHKSDTIYVENTTLVHVEE